MITRFRALSAPPPSLLTAKLMNSIKVYAGSKGTKQQMEVTLVLLYSRESLRPCMGCGYTSVTVTWMTEHVHLQGWLALKIGLYLSMLCLEVKAMTAR